VWREIDGAGRRFVFFPVDGGRIYWACIANAAQDAASSVGDTLADVIHERPIATLALALGLGFLIGVTWRR